MTRFSHVVSPKLASTTATGFVVLTVQGRPFVALKSHLLEPDLWGILLLSWMGLAWWVFLGRSRMGALRFFFRVLRKVLVDLVFVITGYVATVQRVRRGRM